MQRINYKTVYIYGSDGTRILNQKWHLLITVYAYLEVINNIFPYNSFYSKRKISTFKKNNFFDLDSLIYYEKEETKNSYCLINNNYKLNYYSIDLITWMLEAACIKMKYNKERINEILTSTNNSEKLNIILHIIQSTKNL